MVKIFPTFIALCLGLIVFIQLDPAALSPVLQNGRVRPLETVAEKDAFARVPAKKRPKEWLPLTVFETDHNKTAFSDAHFREIKKAYADEQPIDGLILDAYLTYREGTAFPRFNQLKAELFYHKYPLLQIALISYTLALIFCLMGRLYTAESLLILAFAVHTLLLLLRFVILERPPVSNMQESLLFVPWVAVFLSFLFHKAFKKESLLVAGFLSCVLLTFAGISFDGHGLENAPAVLNSRFWLTIHVLMVVSSYAFFLLGGLLAHIHLVTKNNDLKPSLSKAILTILYAGTFFLISGTILGGVWAQASWGRFWDWDPKESWAFISSCLYLVLIHLYRFGYIRERGLSCGAIVGLLSIGFTWYGVNYLLGTGLHSYGFGSGGALWFGLYTLLEIIFLSLISRKILQKRFF